MPIYMMEGEFFSKMY